MKYLSECKGNFLWKRKETFIRLEMKFPSERRGKFLQRWNIALDACQEGSGIWINEMIEATCAWTQTWKLAVVNWTRAGCCSKRNSANPGLLDNLLFWLRLFWLKIAGQTHSLKLFFIHPQSVEESTNFSQQHDKKVVLNIFAYPGLS